MSRFIDTRFQKFGTALALATAVLLSGGAAHAIGFSCITGNNATQCGIGEAQFSATLAAFGAGQVSITFLNSGPTASFIAQVYIDDDASAFAGIASITDGTGTDFEIGGSPPNLPGGNTVSPVFTATARAAADKPGTNKDGADPGESFSLILSLSGGVSFADVASAIDGGTIRLGIHGQGLGEGTGLGGSEAFVNGGGPAVPEPSAMLLFAVGALVVARRVRASD
jgi:hypothetical protein